jgi:hypothetical protein
MPKQPDKRQDKSEQNVEDDDKRVEYQGLPGVESHIGSLVVESYGQKEERRDRGEVGDCANKVVRETGFF